MNFTFVLNSSLWYNLIKEFINGSHAIVEGKRHSCSIWLCQKLSYICHIGSNTQSSNSLVAHFLFLMTHHNVIPQHYSLVVSYISYNYQAYTYNVVVESSIKRWSHNKLATSQNWRKRRIKTHWCLMIINIPSQEEGNDKTIYLCTCNSWKALMNSNWCRGIIFHVQSGHHFGAINLSSLFFLYIRPIAISTQTSMKQFGYC